MVVVATVTPAVARAALPASPWRVLAVVAIPLLACSAMLWWIAANRVALDLVTWCDCARDATTVRVILSPQRSVPADVGEAPLPASAAGTTLRE